MDIKSEEEFKIELLQTTKEDDKKINVYLGKLSTIEEIQERNCYESINMKSEIKEEPFDIKEEVTKNDELLDKICGLDQNQSFIINAAEEEKGSERKSSLRSRSRRELKPQQSIKKNHLKNISMSQRITRSNKRKLEGETPSASTIGKKGKHQEISKRTGKTTPPSKRQRPVTKQQSPEDPTSTPSTSGQNSIISTRLHQIDLDDSQDEEEQSPAAPEVNTAASQSEGGEVRPRRETERGLHWTIADMHALLFTDGKVKFMEGFEYSGLDLRTMLSDISKNYNNKDEMTKDLVIVNSVTFIRGYSYNKVTKNIKDPTKAALVISAMNRLKVSHGTKPGPTDVTLGRISLLAPQCHPDFIHQGRLPKRRQVLYIIPKVANCGSFVSCIPTTHGYDGLFNCGVLYNIYRNTIINPDKNTTLVKTVYGFNRTSRYESVLKEEDKVKYMKVWKLDKYNGAHNFDWINPVLQTTMNMTIKVGWNIICNYSAGQQEVWRNA